MSLADALFRRGRDDEPPMAPRDPHKRFACFLE